MIPDHGRYYGCVFAQLIDDMSSPIRISKPEGAGHGFYLIDERILLYIKFSRNRKGPWTFNFMRDHRNSLEMLVGKFDGCVIALVCGKDGIVALDYVQLRDVLDEEVGEQSAVIVRRKLRHMYSVSGTSGRLPRKIARDALVGAVTVLKGAVATG
jgi:hypothetical protein